MAPPKPTMPASVPTADLGIRSVGKIITSVDHDCCPKNARLKIKITQATECICGTNITHGISAALACLEDGMKRSRVFVHGTASLVRAAARPVSRVIRGDKPQLRFCLAQILHAVGKQLGALGVRIDHR